MSSEKHRKHKKKHSNRKFIITIIIVGVVALLAGGIFYYIQSSQKNVVKNPAKERELTPIEQAEEVSSKAQGQAALGKVADAYKAYDEAIAKSNDAKIKSWLLVNKAITAINSKKLTEAAEFARQAEAVLPTYSTSQAMAQVAEARGDKSSATKYYQKTIERYTTEAKDTPFYEGDLATFKAKVKELSR